MSSVVFSSGYADEAESDLSNLSVCAVFKNESKDLVEWIEYHKMIGVDHFYLYNVNSSDNYRSVLRRYLREGTVTLVNWPDFSGDKGPEKEQIWMLGSKLTAYENAIQFRAKDRTQWLVLLDVNEYLVPDYEEGVLDCLSTYHFFDSLKLASCVYDAPAVNESPFKRLKIESKRLARNPVSSPFVKVTKEIFRPSEYLGFSWPPYNLRFREGSQFLSLDTGFVKVNTYVKRNVGSPISDKLARRINVNRSGFQPEQVDALLDEDYILEDEGCSACRYVPKLLQRMQ